MNYQYDLTELRAHASGLTTQAAAVEAASQTMATTGAGSKEMYGILIGQIAHPLLQLATDGGQGVISGLADLVTAVSEGMDATVAAYELTEQDHVDRTQLIVTELDGIAGVN